MSTVNLDNLTPDDLVALDARIKDLRAQREAAATAAADTPQPTTFAPPITVDPAPVEETTKAPAESEAKQEATPESLLAAIGVAQTPDQLANAKAWIESHLGITLP